MSGTRKFLVSGLIVLGAIIVVMFARVLTYGKAAQGAETTSAPLPAAIAVDAAGALSRLSAAIKIKTVTYKSGDPVGEEAAQPWLDLRAFLEESYPLTHAAMKREIVADYTLLYTWQGSDSSLAPTLLMAHQDVVPVNEGTLDEWQRPAFSGEIADGYIYGRGTQDDKASVITILEATEGLIASGFKPKRTVILLFGHDEEVSGSGASAAIDVLHARGVRPELVVDEGFMVVEDTPGFTSPLSYIGVSEKGYMTLHIVSEATGGHSSMPPRNSANIQLAKALLALEENQLPSHLKSDTVSQFFKSMAAEMPFMQRFMLANTWITAPLVEKQMASSGVMNAMIRTTMAPTMLSGSVKENVLPQKATALVNFRIHPEDSSESVRAHVEKVLANIDGVSIDRDAVAGFSSEPAPVSPTDNKAFSVMRAVAANTGGERAPVVPALVLGGTDSRYAVKISKNIYRFVPARMTMADTKGIHGTNERLAVSNIPLMVEGYAHMIQGMDRQ